MNYFEILLSYEIPYNILEDNLDPSITKARDILYETLKDSIPSKYDRFSVKLVIYQLKDTYNYLVSYSAFIRCDGELPMSEYVAARDIKDKIKNELEEFFNSVDCEYKQINIKSLV